jgi:hypothetical protein
MNYRTYFSGPLTAVRYAAERDRNVLVKLFVQSFNEELGVLEVLPIDWRAARALAIEDVLHLRALMANDPFFDQVEQLLEQSAEENAAASLALAS